MSVPFIAVEGPIGVGKTSLATLIAKKENWRLLEEIVDENPFLDKFYENTEEWSFQTEMFFLCNRYKQLQDIQHNYLQLGKPVVADYHIFKNIIFARRTLSVADYDKYEEIYRILVRDMPSPTMIIYLNASAETLFQRIAMRGRSFEQKISPTYLKQLITDYEIFINQYTLANPTIPVLRINGDFLDFVEKENDREWVLKQVQQLISKGEK